MIVLLIIATVGVTNNSDMINDNIIEQIHTHHCTIRLCYK